MKLYIKLHIIYLYYFIDTFVYYNYYIYIIIITIQLYSIVIMEYLLNLI